MSGMQNIHAANSLEKLIGWGEKTDDGVLDLSSRHVLSISREFTIAQLNAGSCILIPAAYGRKIMVTGFFIKFTGNFASLSEFNLNIYSMPGSPTSTVVSIPVAQAQDGNIHTPSKGTHTMYDNSIGTTNDIEDAGLEFLKTGDPATGGTSVLVSVQFRIYQ